MLAQWLDRGFGQMLAPDERIASMPKEEEPNTSIWSVLAPDPVWEASQHGPNKDSQHGPKMGPSEDLRTPGPHGFRRQKSHPPPEAFDLTSPPSMPKEVVCQHCHRCTPVIVPPSTPTAQSIGSSAKAKPEAQPEFMSPLEKGVIVTARAFTQSVLSPPHVRSSVQKVFRFCSSAKPLQDVMLQKLRKWLEEDPSLLSARASSMGNLVPDGFTPLMATAHCNQLDAAKIILDLDASTKSHVDLQGRTALHIAAEMGSLDVVRLLQSNDTLGPLAPVDLAGRTALGRAITSHQKTARRAQTQLQQVLFSPGDKSVMGKKSPTKERIVHTNVPLGYAQVPGFRVNMEDALSIHTWKEHSLVGVCDGHGDNAEVSTFVADQVKEVYTKTAEQLPVDQRWVTTCLELDQMVKATGKIGGSTGVWALVTESTIVTVNVGDCRCILIQEEEQQEQLAEKMEAMRIEPGVEETKEDATVDTPQEAKPTSEESKEEASPRPIPGKEGEVEFTKGGEQTSETGAAAPSTPEARYQVTALSTDHKPDLAWEQARVEKAGLSVVKETFYDEDGMKQEISKIQLAEGHRMAVARAFGDFEYKSNKTLGPEEQAVSAIPEVKSRVRSKKDMYLVLACDGIWDVMTNDQVGEFVVHEADKALAAEEADILPKVCDLLLDECLKRRSKDNLSVVIVALTVVADKVASSGAIRAKALQY